MGRLQIFFSHSGSCQLTLMMVSFSVQKLSVLALIVIDFGVFVMKSLPIPMSWMVLLMFSSSVFMVLGFMFKSLIHLDFILV